MLVVSKVYLESNLVPAATGVVLRSPVEILIRTKKCILPTDTFRTGLNHIRRFVFFYIAGFEMVASFNPIFYRFTRLSAFIRLHAGNI